MLQLRFVMYSRMVVFVIMALRPSRNHRHQDHLRLSALHRQRRAIALAPWTPFLNRGELLEACLIDPEVVHQVHQARTDSRTETIHGHPSNRIGGNRKTIGGSLNQVIDSLRVLLLPRHHAGVKIRTNRARPMITDTATGTGIAITCLLYTSPSPRDATLSRMPSSA